MVRAILICVCVIVALAVPLSAQEFQVRTYSVTPVGLNFVAAGYAFSTGNILMDPSLPIEDLKANLHILFARYTRSVSLFNRMARLKILVPWGAGDWEGTLEGQFRTRKIDGVGDLRVALETVVLGAPAMKPAEAASYEPATLVGARVQIGVPVGVYDDSKLINLGSNRWTFIPELGLSHTRGAWTLEAAVGAWLFTNNSDFFGGNKLEQRPLLVAKFHVLQMIQRGLWWAIGAGYGYGGRSYVNGEPRATLQRNIRLTAVLTLPLTRRSGASFAFTSGRNAGAGSDFDGIAAAYQVAF